MPTLNINGRALYYDETGEKDADFTVLFIHGASSSSEIWTEDIMPAGVFRRIKIDLPGHGRSEPPGRRTVAHYAAIVEHFIRSHAPAQLILVGHSMGSAIALTIAHRSFVPVSGLILMGASARMPVGAPILAGAMADLGQVAEFVAEYGLAQRTEKWQEEIRQQVMATGGMTTYGDYLACNRFDLRPHLPTIDTPTLIIAGRQDNMTPLRFSESTAAALPRGEIAILEDTGHYAMIESPDAVRQLMTDFLHHLARPLQSSAKTPGD